MILGVGMGDASWLQAQLPVSGGGLGILSSINFSSAAYLSSFSSSKGQITDLVPNLQLTCNNEALAHHSQILELEEPMDKETFECISQRELTLRIEDLLIITVTMSTIGAIVTLIEPMAINAGGKILTNHLCLDGILWNKLRII